MVFLLWSTCLAQWEFRSVAGVVTDKSGNALPGAVVEIDNAATLWMSSYVTGKDGRYHFAVDHRRLCFEGEISKPVVETEDA